jgi:MerR family transcriptional regulator/heat shock protein HspR
MSTDGTSTDRRQAHDTRPKYMIGVAAALLDLHPQTLRMYEARGIVRPRRTAGGTRLYSDVDLARVRRVTELAGGLGLSLQGAEYALELEDELARRARRIADLEAALEDAARRRRAEVDEVHRSYRRELVLYRPPGGAVVRRGATSSRTHPPREPSSAPEAR